MAFPVDQFMSPPPAANTTSRPQGSARPQIDDNVRRDDTQAHRSEDRRENESRTAARTETEHSDFQRHLDDEANDRASQRAEPQTAQKVEGDNDSSNASLKAEDTHGYQVSQVARATEAPHSTDPSDVTVMAQAGKGTTVKATAASKSHPEIKTNDDGKTADTTSLKVEPVIAQTGAEPTVDQPAVPDQSAAPIISAPVEPAPQTSQSSPAETTAEGAEDPVEVASDTAVNTAAALPVPDNGAPTAGTAADGQPENVSAAPAPHYNENAQKVEGSARPGWGAEHAPRSERGTLARDLKSQNSEKTSSDIAVTQVKTESGSTSPAEVDSGVGAVEAPTSTTTPVDETPVEESLAPEQIVNPSNTTPNLSDPAIMATPATAQGSPVKGEAADLKGLSTVSDKSATAPNAPSSAPGNTPGSAEKSAASQPVQNGSATPATPADPLAGTTADANAAPNASPTGVAKALANGQGKMPMTSTLTAEEAALAMAGTDKRGTRTGAKAADAPGDAVSPAKAIAAKAEGNAQSAFDPGQHKANTGSPNQAAQPHTSSTPANPQAGSQMAQGTMPPVMPDLATLTNPADMSLPRGNATMEIDPMTGALHLSGTGSAKMSAPNLSEVTMQFSRARMVQTPAKDIAVQIAKHLSGGVNRFDIRITPPELGRIEVKLEIAESGKISAHLVADKPETLDLLQKDRATLEKALAEAGLDADGSSLEFSMREGSDDNDKNFKNLGMEVADDASDGQGTLRLQEHADLEVSAYGFDIVRMKRLDISI